MWHGQTLFNRSGFQFPDLPTKQANLVTHFCGDAQMESWSWKHFEKLKNTVIIRYYVANIIHSNSNTFLSFPSVLTQWFYVILFHFLAAKLPEIYEEKKNVRRILNKIQAEGTQVFSISWSRAMAGFLTLGKSQGRNLGSLWWLHSPPLKGGWRYHLKSKANTP